MEKKLKITWIATIDLACSWTINWNDPPKRWAAAAAAAADDDDVVAGRTGGG